MGALRKIQLQEFRAKSVRSGPPGRFSHSFWYRDRNSKNTLNMSFESNGIDWVRCEKFSCKFFRTKMVQSRPLGHFSHSFWYRNQNSKNALNMSFGSNGMDWVHLLRKIQLQVFRTKSVQSGPPGRFSHNFSLRKKNSKNTLNMNF